MSSGRLYILAAALAVAGSAAAQNWQDDPACEPLCWTQEQAEEYQRQKRQQDEELRRRLVEEAKEMKRRCERNERLKELAVDLQVERV
ncbi:MAG: hypothetical protein GWN09_04545 [Gammaproteobacteria bacterium]|nr:hypothetical protein [Gammaproteobacteria bacterium]